MAIQTKRSYKITLLCLLIILYLGFHCGAQKLYIMPNMDNQALSQRKKDPKPPLQRAKENTIWYAKCKAAWESKTLVLSKEVAIQEMASTIPPQLPKEASALPNNFVQNNIVFLMQQYSTFDEQVKQLCLQLPSAYLELLVSKLEEAQNKDACIDALLQTAPPATKATFLELRFELVKRLWLCFVEWIQEPETLRQIPKETQEEMLKEFPKEMPEEDEAEMLELILRETLKRILKGMSTEKLKERLKEIQTERLQEWLKTTQTEIIGEILAERSCTNFTNFTNFTKKFWQFVTKHIGRVGIPKESPKTRLEELLRQILKENQEGFPKKMQ